MAFLRSVPPPPTPLPTTGKGVVVVLVVVPVEGEKEVDWGISSWARVECQEEMLELEVRAALLLPRAAIVRLRCLQSLQQLVEVGLEKVQPPH